MHRQPLFLGMARRAMWRGIHAQLIVVMHNVGVPAPPKLSADNQAWVEYKLAEWQDAQPHAQSK